MSFCDPVKSEIKLEVEEKFIVEGQAIEESVAESDFYRENKANINAQIKNEATRKRGREAKEFTCSHCRKVFTTNYGLRMHLLIHADKKPLKCKICKRGFRHTYSLNCHMMRHKAERPNVCKICKMAFRLAQTLKIHMLSHSDDRPYVCEICKIAYRWPQSLKNHMTERRGMSAHKFKCSHCLKVFTNNCGLETHLKMHGDISFKLKCPDCLKVFITSEGLKFHSAIHTSTERAFDDDSDEKPAIPKLDSSALVLKEEIKVEEIQIEESVKEEFNPVDGNIYK